MLPPTIRGSTMMLTLTISAMILEVLSSSAKQKGLKWLPERKGISKIILIPLKHDRLCSKTEKKIYEKATSSTLQKTLRTNKFYNVEHYRCSRIQGQWIKINSILC